jgi:hypothetical protein
MAAWQDFGKDLGWNLTSDCQVTLGAGSLTMVGKGRRWRHGKILIRIWDETYLRLPGDAGCRLPYYGGEREKMAAWQDFDKDLGWNLTSDCQVTLGAGSLAMVGKGRRWRHGKILIRIWDGAYFRLPGDAG